MHSKNEPMGLFDAIDGDNGDGNNDVVDVFASWCGQLKERV